MADDEEITEGAESGDDEVLAAGLGGGKSKAAGLLMYVAGALIAIILMIVISYFIAKSVKTEAYKEEQNIVIAPAPPPLKPFKFQKEFRVNTADMDEAALYPAFLTFGYDPENLKLETELIQRQAQMMHIINIVLGGKKKEDLSTPLQKLNLAEEIKSQVNMILRDGKIIEVYFEELVVS